MLESLVAAGALDCFGFDRAAMMAGIERMIGMAQRAQDNALSGQTDIFGTAGEGRRRWICPPPTPGCRPSGCIASSRRSASTSRPTRSTNTSAALDKMRVQSWADFRLGGEARGKRRPAGRHRHPAQERKTRTGNKMGVVQFSDTSGQYEAVVFSEGLAQYRDLLEPGRSVVITVSAEDRPEGINLRIQTVESLDELASRVQKALRIFLRDAAPLGTLAGQLAVKGEGQVSFVLIKEGGQGEVEIALPDRYRVSPHIASAMRAVPGVVEVELVYGSTPRRGGGQSAGRLAPAPAPPLPNV